MKLSTKFTNKYELVKNLPHVSYKNNIFKVQSTNSLLSYISF